MAVGTLSLIVLGLIVAVVALVYFIGIPAEWKESAQDAVVKNMAETEARDRIKEQIDKLPQADQKRAQQIEKGVNSLTGGDLKNPLGKFSSAVKNE